MSFETLIVILFICFCLWNLQRNVRKVTESPLAKAAGWQLWKFLK